MDEEHNHSNTEDIPEGFLDLDDFSQRSTDGRANLQTLLTDLLAARTASQSGIIMGDPRTFPATAIASLLSADHDQELEGEFGTDDEGDADYLDEDDAMEDDEDDVYPTSRTVFTYPPSSTPQAAGVNLIKSGEFGRVGPKIKARKNNRNLAAVLNNRLARTHPVVYKEDYAANVVPNSNGVIVANYDANIYTAQFSNGKIPTLLFPASRCLFRVFIDSSFFYTCSQDFRLHIFDTTAPPQKAISRVDLAHDQLQTTLNLSRRIQGQHGRWTITDANLSPDNDRIIYSSITSTAYMCSTREENPVQIPIPFHDSPGVQYGFWDSGPGSFGLFSCRFSADGNEVIAGGRGYIYVYDLLANKRSVKILAHRDDVNSCCWADTSSGNVLVSASDDSYLKVWDRRSLGSSPKPSGVLIGHTEGITYVSAKGDGRYVVSNGKDQAMRLWDLRKMRSSADYESTAHIEYGVPNFDYRYPSYPKPKYKAHPLDCSVMTYRGHSVLMTLIRCHFSPIETTGGQYLYSGSADGRIHIWSLDGTLIQVLDRTKSLSIREDPSGVEYRRPAYGHNGSCVRDVSWSSEQPAMISAAWESSRHGSTLARHEWKGLSKMSLQDWEEKRQQEQRESTQGGSSMRRSSRIQQQRLRRLLMPGTYRMGDDDDDEDM